MSDRHTTYEKPHVGVAEGVDVENQYYGYSLPEVIETVIQLGIGRNRRFINGKKRAWSSDTSKGIRPSYMALYEIVSPGKRNVTNARIALTVKRLSSLIKYMEPNAEEWNGVLQSAYSRFLEGGSILDYDISDFWEKFTVAGETRGGEPLLVGPFYLDVIVGRTSTRLQSDVSFRSLTPPVIEMGGSLHVFGSHYFEETGTKSYVLSMKPSGDDFFSVLHREMLATKVEEADWAHQPIWAPLESAPVSFILKRERALDENSNVKKDVVNCFSSGEHFSNFLNFPISDDARALGPSFIYATGPVRIESLAKIYQAPIVCGQGYGSPDGSFSEFSNLARQNYESGKCALIVGSFYEFCRTFDKQVDEDTKWELDYRKQHLKQALSNIAKGTAVVSRCMNYGSGKLNLFVFCNGLLRDLSDAVIDIEIDNFFFIARKFDAALVNEVMQVCATEKPEDNFSTLCQCAIRAAQALSHP